MKTYIFKASKIALLIFVFVSVAILILHIVGCTLNKRIPKGGINESRYVHINGTEQWISIYGENKNNPILLYLHGGPGSSTSHLDYAFTRQWADIYTIVTWDQRNCGKSYDSSQNETPLTKNLLMEDGKEMTEFLLSYFSVEKISLLGHSWGSIFGANLALEFPEYYDCFIGTGQLIDFAKNEMEFKDVATAWATGDEEAMALVDKLTPGNVTIEHLSARNQLMEKYGYAMMRDGSDYNAITTMLFNPYYSVADWIKYIFANPVVYFDFINSEEFQSFSLEGKYVYQIPYININGDEDYQSYYKIAEDYFSRVDAPVKYLFIMEHTTHGLLESKSQEFSGIIHQIPEVLAVI